MSATEKDALWFDAQERAALGYATANVGTRLGEVEAEKAARYRRAAAALRAVESCRDLAEGWGDAANALRGDGHRGERLRLRACASDLLLHVALPDAP